MGSGRLQSVRRLKELQGRVTCFQPVKSSLSLDSKRSAVSVVLPAARFSASSIRTVVPLLLPLTQNRNPA